MLSFLSQLNLIFYKSVHHEFTYVHIDYTIKVSNVYAYILATFVAVLSRVRLQYVYRVFEEGYKCCKISTSFVQCISGVYSCTWALVGF